MTPAQRQRGVALLTAMLLVAMATVIATDVIWEDNLRLRRASNMLYLDQATQYALGAEAWAADTLRVDLSESKNDHLNEVWAVDLPPLPVDGGYIEGILIDMQGRFNLNNLVLTDGSPNEIQLDLFRRLLTTLELEPRLATVVLDWLDPDVEVSFPDGAEDDVYTSVDPPYRAANGPITSTSELLAMNGFDLNAYRALKPHVAALPIGTTINVNTASAVVLASLSDDLSLMQAEGMVEARLDAPYEGLEQFEAQVPPELMAWLSDATSYFQAETRVTLGTTRFTMYSLLERDQSGAVRTRVRKFGAE